MQAGRPGNNPGLQALPRACRTPGRLLSACGAASAHTVRTQIADARVRLLCVQEVWLPSFRDWCAAALPKPWKVQRSAHCGVATSAVAWDPRQWTLVLTRTLCVSRGGEDRVLLLVRLRRTDNGRAEDVVNVNGFHSMQVAELQDLLRILYTGRDVQRRCPPGRRCLLKPATGASLRPAAFTVLAGDLNLEVHRALRVCGATLLRRGPEEPTCCLADADPESLSYLFDHVYASATCKSGVARIVPPPRAMRDGPRPRSVTAAGTPLSSDHLAVRLDVVGEEG